MALISIQTIGKELMLACRQLGHAISETLAVLVASTVVNAGLGSFYVERPIDEKDARVVVEEAAKRILSKEEPGIACLRLQAAYESSVAESDREVQTQRAAAKAAEEKAVTKIAGFTAKFDQDFDTLTILYKKIYQFLLLRCTGPVGSARPQAPTSQFSASNLVVMADGVDERLQTSSNDMVNSREEKFCRRSSSMRLAGPPKAKPVEGGGCFSFLRSKPVPQEVDVVLIGAGIMSATVGLLLKQLEPNWKITMIERLGAAAEESSNGFNNAGTGHAGFMEPNYTKEVEKDGKKTVTSEKIVTICEQFMLSRQYWTTLAEKKLIADPDCFIHQSDHIALGIGEDQVEFIKKRYEVMKNLPLFSSIEMALDKETQTKWAPLIWEGRDPSDKVAMTRIKYGTDVDFGALAKEKVKAFTKLGGDLRLFTQVTGVKKEKDGKWLITTSSNSVKKVAYYRANFVFVGAGGWALHMLQKSQIPEVRGYMALPVTGDWAMCQNPEVVKKHKVKVYAPGAPGAPPMSMPHLDFRTIGGKEMLLFGPFGSITFKFLRYGSVLDALKAVRPHNLLPTAAVMLCEAPDLVIMLMKDVFKSGAGRLHDIRHYYPEANPEDWTFIPAGVRAQIIKKDPKKVGTLQFGTEVVASADGSIVGLLGASPGASICVSTALDVLAKCFGSKPCYESWKPKLKELIPSFGEKLSSTPGKIPQVYARTTAGLGL